jgi:hypothetical protein
MMRRFVKTVGPVLAGVAALASVSGTASTANAQEIQLTGPLAGAPATRKLRLHRAGRFEVALTGSFSLLDQYLRTIMPGAMLTYHPTDWIGFGVWGGYGFQYSTGLTDELQDKAVTARNCAANPTTKACQLTAVNLTRGSMSADQLGHIQWVAAPQVVAVPFRGKISLFGLVAVDTDVDVFAGAAIIGMRERAPCGNDTDGTVIAATADGGGPCASQASFKLASRIAVAPTFGLGLNFYPTTFFGLGFEFRAMPFSWNTSGFDNHGGGNNKDFPDNNVNSDDREFHFTTMTSIQAKFAFPIKIKVSE